MRWSARRESTNVEDQRGRFPMRGGAGIGCGGFLVVLCDAGNLDSRFF